MIFLGWNYSRGGAYLSVGGLFEDLRYLICAVCKQINGMKVENKSCQT